MMLKHFTIKWILFFCFSTILFFNSFSGKAQTTYQKIDSLKNLLATELTDTSKIINYRLLAVYYETIDFDSAMYFYDEAMRLSEQNNLPKETALTLINMAFSYKYVKNSEVSVNFISQAIQILEKEDAKKELLNAYYNLGTFLGSFEHFPEAIQAFGEAVLVGEALQDSAGLAMVYNNLGLMYQYTGAYDKAIEYQIMALKLKEAIHDNTVYVSHINIGVSYNMQNNSEMAIEHFEQSLALQDENNTQAKIICYNGIGEAYQNAGDMTNALLYYQKVYALCKQNNDYNGMARYHMRIGNIFMSKNELQKAEEAFQKAKEIYPENGSKKLKASLLSSMASLSLKFYAENKEKKRLDNCIAYATEMHDIAQEIGMLNHINKSAELLYKAYKEAGNMSDALAFAEIYIQTKDSLYNKEKIRVLNEVQVKYETEKKEQQIAFLNEKQKLHHANETRNLWIAILAFFITLVVLVFLFVILRSREKIRKRNQRIDRQRAILEKSNKKLKELSAFKEDMTSMMVHDLKAPLSSIIQYSNNSTVVNASQQMLLLIANIIDIQKFEEAKMQLELQNTTTHEVINQTLEIIIPLAQEKNLSIVNTIQNYSLQADPQLLVRLLSNLLSNAVKFSSGNKNIILETEQHGKELKISVKNDGQTIPQEWQYTLFEKFTQQERKKLGVSYSSGIGLAFCKMAAEAHGGRIGVISGEETGVEFWFTLPLQNTEILPDNKKDIDYTIPLVLSEDDVKMAKKLLKALENTAIYESSKFETAMKLTENASAGFKTWLTLLVQKYYTMDEPLYRAQLNELAEKTHAAANQ